MRKSQSLQPLPLPSSLLQRDEGLSLLIPNGTLTTGTPEPKAVLWLPIVSSGSWEQGRGLGLPQPARAGESPLGRSVRPLPRRHRHRNLLQSPNGFEGAFSKCSKACGWREKPLFFRLCFHFITQLLNFVVKYISIWNQTPTFITFPYIFCLEKRELPHQNQFTWWIWFGICNPPWGNNAVRGT